MSDDWKPGDLALCVRAGLCPIRQRVASISVGVVYTVREVGVAKDDLGRPRLVLALTEFPPPRAFNAICFRKINPLTDEEREQFTEDLNAPVKETVDG